MSLILASASPRRKELLRLITDDFKVVTADVDETVPDDIDIFEAPSFLALKKAKAVAEKNKKSVILGADTAVFLGKKMLGKPENKEEAEKMLSSLSGKEHLVITGCAVISEKEIKTFSVKTYVKFKSLTKKEIKDYIATGEPMDKAGAYGIQGRGALFVEKINGDYYNVVGLPVEKLNIVLNSF